MCKEKEGFFAIGAGTHGSADATTSAGEIFSDSEREDGGGGGSGGGGEVRLGLGA